MMRRDLCFKALAQRLPGDIVVSTYSSAFEWLPLRPSPLNYVAVGAMGLASSHGLGLAMGLPGRRVVVLDGDGSLLMNLGTLVTVAAARPANFHHFVCCNGTYETNGSHPLPGGAGAVDFEAMARAAGYAHAFTFDALDEFERCIDGVLAKQGPVFVALRVSPGPVPLVPDYGHIHGKHAREAFKAALRAPDRAVPCQE